MLNIGNRLELFWDDYLIDSEKTTATQKLHSPVKKETVIVHDAPWEGDGCNYYNLVCDNGLYRLYYLGWDMISPDKKQHTTTSISVCYAESRDGIHWEKPNLGICEFNGSKNNNIILDNTTDQFDNFMVFIDDNPKCPKEERYKGIAVHREGGHVLWCYTSGDGIHFKYSHPITDKGWFDSLNTGLYDAINDRYLCYIRDFHGELKDGKNAGDRNLATDIRDIRCIESKDFKTFTDPVLLDFCGGEDYPLYTNCISKYYRAPHMLVGFPTRYVERKQWSDNYDVLCGKEKRLERMKLEKRYGLVVTDCVFMSSRDGYRWNRFDEAFLRPGPERPTNWVYGDCYPCVGMIETRSDDEGADNELSMYIGANHWMGIPAELNRYTIRIDGFVSYHATYKPQVLTTKPFIFNGSTLKLNFETSARGNILIKLSDLEGNKIESGEIFGDKVERNVNFGGNLSAFSGKPVIMEMEMSDADIYSVKFD